MLSQINKEEAHFLSSFEVSDIMDDEWKIIEKQKDSFIISDDCDTSFLKWPGYVFSNLEAKEAYEKIYKDFVDKKTFTPSRGNLSKNNNYIFIGIRPSHAMPISSNRELAGFPCWFLGESSSFLCRYLSQLNIYPYVLNVYSSPSQPFNKDFRFVFKELVVIFYIYKNIYNISDLNLVFMGSYEEYPLLVRHIKRHPIFNNFKINLKCYSIWHPSYLVRSYSDNKFEEWKNQMTKRRKEILC